MYNWAHLYTEQERKRIYCIFFCSYSFIYPFENKSQKKLDFVFIQL